MLNGSFGIGWVIYDDPTERTAPNCGVMLKWHWALYESFSYSASDYDIATAMSYTNKEPIVIKSGNYVTT